MTISSLIQRSRSIRRLDRTASSTALGLATAVALLAWIPSAPAMSQDEPPPLASGVIGYQLSASWNEQQWQARAGHFGETGDISALPDGRLIVLDRRLNALHELDAEGRALDLWQNPDHKADPESPWRWQRLDAGADGRLHVLSRSETGEATANHGPSAGSWTIWTAAVAASAPSTWVP